MLAIARWFSLAGRRRDLMRDRRRVLVAFEERRQALAGLPPPRPRAGTTLLVRLDDIGDYLLFRNQLPYYHAAAQRRGEHLTLLGNRAWRPLFEALDATSVDAVLWLEKDRFLQSAAYRQEQCSALRERGVDTVIAT